MSFVIYHIKTTLIYGGYRNTHKTERAAKAALTRAVNKGKITDRSEYAIAGILEFDHSIEKQVERTNMMSRKKYMEGVNTPAFMSPACESYWSM